MKPPLLTKITIAGYKSFRKLELELRPLNVLVGANGVGKSNLISFFRLIPNIGDKRLQRVVAEAGGADSFLRYGKKTTKRIFFNLEFDNMAYEVVLQDDATDLLFKYDEKFLGYAENSTEIQEVTFIDGGRIPEEPSRINLMKNLVAALLSIRTYHLNDTSKTATIKGFGRLNDNIVLRSDAENLAAILFKIRTQNLKAYQTIRDVIRSVAPYFDDFDLKPNLLNEDTIRLEWREYGSDPDSAPFIARDLSDGTLRFMALTTLLLQPEPPAIIVIDEPELGLHPFAIEKLAGLLQTTSSRAQLIVATQSPQLIAALEPEDIIVADRKDGETTMQRLNAENLKDWLEEYTLGELWQKNILGGVVNPNNLRSRGNS
jgi:predicted ATPase